MASRTIVVSDVPALLLTNHSTTFAKFRWVTEWPFMKLSEDQEYCTHSLRHCSEAGKVGTTSFDTESCQHCWTHKENRPRYWLARSLPLDVQRACEGRISIGTTFEGRIRREIGPHECFGDPPGLGSYHLYESTSWSIFGQIDRSFWISNELRWLQHAS